MIRSVLLLHILEFCFVAHAEPFQHLHCVHQVSLNTAAIARHLHKVQGRKRRVARTTLTSTALTAPKTMPSETSQSQSSASPAPASSTGAQEVDVGGAGDGSFETVAEALRLQWSVIGEIFLGFFFYLGCSSL